MLGLTDGAVIDVGRVVGPAGATGPTGGVGLPGNDGADGAAVLSGPRAPQADDGNAGDHWIDISSAEFSFFKKDGDGWTKLANLRQPARDPRVGVSGGAGGAGGGGGGELQNTRTLPLVNGGSTVRKKAQAKNLPTPGAMSSQEDANLYFLECLNRDNTHVGVAAPAPPYTAGQLWFSTEDSELTLFVYDGNDWVVASPPVSLDGIEEATGALQLQVDFLAKNMTPAEAHLELYGKHDALEVSQAEQDEKLNDLCSSTGSNSDRLDEIDEKFEELDRTLAVGKWRFIQDGSASNPQNGEFTLTRVDGSQPVRRWEEVAFASISKVDNAGVTHDISTWANGDRIEFYSTMDDGHAVFTIGDYAGLDTQLVFTNLLEFYGTPQTRLEYRIRHFAAGDGIGFDEADQRYVNATGDTMTGVLTLKQKGENSHILKINTSDEVQALKLYSDGDGTNLRADVHADKNLKFVANGSQLFKVYGSGKTFLGGLVDPTGDTHAAHKKYVDDAIAGIGSGNTSYLPLSGGTLTGGLEAPELTLELGKSTKPMGFEVRSGISNSPTMWVDKSGTNLYVKGDVYAVCSSNSNHNEQYKGRRLATINLVEKIEEHPGYQMRWQYKGSGDLQKGYFKISGDFIYLDKYDHDGKNLLVPMCAKDHGASDCGGIMTIYEIVSNKYTPVQVWQIERSRFGHTYNSRSTLQLEAKGSHKPLEGTLMSNSFYYITFGGLF